MSAFLAFLGGAAGEWNKMDEEKRIAASEKAKKEAEALAALQAQESEFEWWKKKEEYTAGQEEQKATADRRAQQKEQQQRYMQLTPELQMLTKSLPNKFHYISRSTESGMPSIVSVDRPADGYTFEDAIKIAREQNTQLQNFGVFYAPEPLPNNPQQYTLNLRDLKDKDTGPLFSSQTDAQKAADAEAKRLEDAGVTNLRTVAVPTTDGKNWTYKVEKTTDKPADAKPPTDPDLDIPFDSSYYFRKSVKFGPETGKTAQQRGADIINLNGNVKLPLGGEVMKDLVEDQDYLVVRRPMGVEGESQRAALDMTYFFDDFKPELAEKIIQNRGTRYGQRSYDLMVSRLSEVLQNWTLGTADEIPSGRQLMPLPPVYTERLEKLAEMDPGIRQMLRDHPANDGTSEALNTQIGNPINEPIMSTGAGGAEVRRNEFFADAFVEENEAGQFIYPQAVVQQVTALAENSGQQPAFIHGLHNAAIDPQTGERTPEAVREAFFGTVQNKEILSNYSFRTVRGERAQYAFPSILADDEARIVENLGNFNTDKERVDALEVALPSLMAKQAHARAQVAANAGPAALYESVTGNSDYDKLQFRLDNARRIVTIDNELQILLGPLQGQVGLPNQITLLKKGAEYLLSNVMPTIVGGEGVDMNQINSSLRTEIDNALKAEDVEAQVAALVRLNVKMQSYAYASMMDPNGRLSDQDRQQAEVATGSEGFTANKDTVLAVSSSLSSAANRQVTMINGYTSNQPRRVVATHLYGRVAGGMPTSVVEFLGLRGPSQLEAERRGTAPAVDNQIMDNINIINQGIGTGTTAPATEDEAI